MSKSERVTISITGIVIVLLALIGVTFAYYLTRIKGNPNDESLVVNTANLELTYTDGNGIIKKENIEPGDVIEEKTFTVKNTGNVKIDDYGVYLEEVINTFEIKKDVTYTLTCTSNIEGKTCNGVENAEYPSLNELLVTNSIDKKEIQSYTLKVTYAETGTDQSVDMNKKAEGRVQIYNQKDVVYITGTVTNAKSGDYVVVESNPKKSQIVDGKYKVVGIEPGNHSIKVVGSDNVVKGSKGFEIVKGKEENVVGDVVTITEKSESININMRMDPDDLNIEIVEVNQTQLSKLIKNQKVKTLDLTNDNFRNGDPYYLYKESTSEYTNRISSSNDKYVATEYTFDALKGNYTLKNYISGANYSDEYVGYYTCGTFLGGGTSYTCEIMYKIEEVSDGNIIKAIKYSKEIDKEITNSGLYKSEDDDGVTYYYRGVIENNYVSFANKIWRIVRINGDGTIRLALNNVEYANLYFNNSAPGHNDVGYTYGNESACTVESPCITDYDVAKNKFINNKTTTNSYLKNYIENTWYKINLKDYDNYIALGSFCNDVGYKTGNFFRYYRGFDTIRNGIPSFKCMEDTKKYTVPSEYGGYYKLKIGHLTTDELYFAGMGSKVEATKSNYLYQGATTKYWLMSPYTSFSNPDGDILLSYGGTVNVNQEAKENFGYFRPVINLKSDVIIKDGDGTKDNPYEVKLD